MNVSLTPHLEEIVKKKVDSGLYNSASEVIREALRLLDEQDRIREMKLAELRKEIQFGLDELDQGKGTPLNIEGIIQRGKERLAAHKKQE